MSVDKINMTYYTGLCKVMHRLLDGLDNVLRAEAAPPGPEHVHSEGPPSQSGWFVGVSKHETDHWKQTHYFTQIRELRRRGCNIDISASIMANEHPIQLETFAIDAINVVSSIFSDTQMLDDYDKAGLIISTKTQGELIFELNSITTIRDDSKERKLQRLTQYLLRPYIARTPVSISITNNGTVNVKLWPHFEWIFKPIDTCFFRPDDD
jgi:hypothetical protein